MDEKIISYEVRTEPKESGKKFERPQEALVYALRASEPMKLLYVVYKDNFDEVVNTITFNGNFYVIDIKLKSYLALDHKDRIASILQDYGAPDDVVESMNYE